MVGQRVPRTVQSVRPREQLIAVLAPDSTQRRPPCPPVYSARPRLPVESGPDLLIGAVRIDRTGRVNERLLFRALGWHPVAGWLGTRYAADRDRTRSTRRGPPHVRH